MSRPRIKPLVYNLEKLNNFITKVSTNTNSKTPNVVFLRSKTRITPLVNVKSYEKEILNIKNEFNNYCTKLLNKNSFYQKNYIFTVDISEKSVRYNKISHLHYDVFLKPTTLVQFSEHIKILQKLSDKMENKLIKLFQKYKFSCQ